MELSVLPIQQDYPTRYTIMSIEPTKYGMTTGTMHLPKDVSYRAYYLSTYLATKGPRPCVQLHHQSNQHQLIGPPRCGTQCEKVIMKNF